MKGHVTLVLMALLGAAVLTRADHRDHDDVKRLRDAGEILSLEPIIVKHRQSRPAGRILEADAWQRLVVEDDGAGCSDEHLARLTRRGSRIDESRVGHGLGLAMRGRHR